MTEKYDAFDKFIEKYRKQKFRAYDFAARKMWHWEELKILPMEQLESDTLIWMQPTGEQDSQGKEIYEGDIISYDFGEGNYNVTDVGNIVDFHDYCGASGLLGADIFIIGDIFNNTNLINTYVNSRREEDSNKSKKLQNKISRSVSRVSR